MAGVKTILVYGFLRAGLALLLTTRGILMFCVLDLYFPGYLPADMWRSAPVV